jgi:hypothetical protein
MPMALPRRSTSPLIYRRLTLIASLVRSHGDPCINVLLGVSAEASSRASTTRAIEASKEGNGRRGLIEHKPIDGNGHDYTDGIRRGNGNGNGYG